MSNNVRDVLLGRWKFGDVPRMKPIRAALDSALNALDAVQEHAALVTKNQNLSPLGRLDEIRAFISKSTAPAIQRGRTVAMLTRGDLDSWRARLLPKPADPKDTAAAILRSEMRTQLRQMSLGPRVGHVVADNPDPILIQAVLEAPSFSTGITDEIRSRMIENYVVRTHPNDLAQIAQLEEAVELLDAATGMISNTTKSVAEFPSDKVFSDFIDKAAPPATKPPLAPPPTTPTSTSDEIYERLLAEGRAEFAALNAS
jgi:hypothetical protein